MKIPSADRAFVDPAKLREYALSPFHPKGRHKAKVFGSCLGLTEYDAELLADALLSAVQDSDQAVRQVIDENGERYMLDFELEGPTGKRAIRSAWIIRSGEDFPRLTTCYVL